MKCLPGLNFSKFVLDFTLEKGGDNDNCHDVNHENEPVHARPRIKHRITSNRWAYVDVDVATRASNAAETCTFPNQKIVQARR